MSNKLIPVSVRASQDELHFAYLGAKTDNRKLSATLEELYLEKCEQEERRENKKRVYKAALRLLGWLGFGFGWGVLAIACSLYAQWWTCIAPAVLMVLAWYKAGGEV